MSGHNRAEFQVTIAAPVEAVWRALRDPVEIRRWFGWDYDGIEAEIEQIFVEEAEAAEEELTITWSHGDVFTLEPRENQTVVRVSRPAPGEGTWDDIYEGWIMFVQQLRFALERHPGEERKVFQLWISRDPASGLPADALGLGKLGSTAIGQRYELDSPVGERMTGVVWYRSPHQIGVSVDGYGDGLIVVAGSDSAPGRGMAIVTTYGRDDAVFERIRARWTAWWQAAYPHDPDADPR
ncbi:MAG TPA: hypothetical protein VD695_00915 [Gaiellaceae bacterium]|nr:hypothetical protein [Gaiellaceae bacterium]